MINRPLISIIVTSYTTERLNDIFDLLQSIKDQSYTNIELIFVAERSANLYKIVKSYAKEKTEGHMKVVFNNEQGLLSARNLGTKYASGDIIGFVDDDVILYPDWTEETVKTYDNDSIIGATGAALPLWEEKAMDWLPEEFYWIVSCTNWFGCDKIQEVRNAWGHSMSFRKEAFEVCRFESALGRHDHGPKREKRGPVGEDTEFSMNLRSRTGKAIVYNPSMKVWHKVSKYRMTSRHVRRQAYWQGYTKAMFKKLYRDSGVAGKDVLSTEYELLQRILIRLPFEIARDFFRHPNIAWRKSLLTFNVLFHLTLGYLSGVSPRLARITEKAYR